MSAFAHDTHPTDESTGVRTRNSRRQPLSSPMAPSEMVDGPADSCVSGACKLRCLTDSMKVQQMYMAHLSSSGRGRHAAMAIAWDLAIVRAVLCKAANTGRAMVKFLDCLKALLD